MSFSFYVNYKKLLVNNDAKPSISYLQRRCVSAPFMKRYLAFAHPSLIKIIDIPIVFFRFHRSITFGR